MNAANKITVSRIALIPFFILFLFIWGRKGVIISFLIFMVASFSDWLDGYIARKSNEITTTGKIMDPVADKILVYAAFICFIYLHVIPFWMVIIIMGRDFMVMALRVELAAKGCILAASFLAKVKTLLEYVALFFAFIYLLTLPSLPRALFGTAVYSVMGLATIFAVISGVYYFLRGMKILAK